jgi:hypothetical protein
VTDLRRQVGEPSADCGDAVGVLHRAHVLAGFVAADLDGAADDP